MGVTEENTTPVNEEKNKEILDGNESKAATLALPEKDTRDVSENTSITAGDEVDAEKGAVSREEEQPPRDISGWKWGLVVFAILSSTFLFALDNTIVADVQPVIVTHFDSVGKIAWLSVAFLIGAASTNLVWGIFGQFKP